MTADRQVHELPQRPADLARFATFMGYPDAASFAGDLLRHLHQVRARYAEVFELLPELLEPGSVATELDFSGVDAAPEGTTEALHKLGFANPERIVTAVRGWQAGHVRALRSARARVVLSQMLPRVLASLAGQPQPDTVFNRFDAFLARQPAGVQLLSLFQRNPTLLDRIAAVLGAAPSLANHLASHPAALDGLLSPDENLDPSRLLRARLHDARLLEDVIEITRRTVREEDFNVSVATMEGRLDADAAGLRRTAIADAALTALLPAVLEDFTARFGRVKGGSMAVVAMGKAGGREMMAGSDLDLMVIYDHAEGASESRGARRLPASQWFVRAAHAYVASVTAPGVDGPLYEVDMRLRPSGNKGPVAVSLASFRHYHAASAWTWERMALTRARVVAGPPALRAQIEAAIAEAMATTGEPDRVRADAAAMRARMQRELPQDGPWDVKLRAGGQIDVEFIAQVLQLIHAREAPGLGSSTTRIALSRLARAGFLSAADAALLVRADHVWRTVQGMLRITVGRGARDELPDASAHALLRAVAKELDGPVDLAALRGTLDVLAQRVRAAFVRYVGEIAP
jgi:glutamate-ammonia-ligase adenylyltransferase